MNTDTKNNVTVSDLQDRLNTLTLEVKNINLGIENGNKIAKEKMNKIIESVNQSIVEAREIFSDLDRAEAEASDELDKLIISEAEDLSSEEE